MILAQYQKVKIQIITRQQKIYQNTKKTLSDNYSFDIPIIKLIFFIS